MEIWHYQKKLLAQIKERYTEDRAFYKDIGEILNLSKSTIYKKIDGTSALSIGDLVNLAKKYKISIDDFYGVSNGLVFQHPYMDIGFKDGADFLEGLKEDLKLLAVAKDAMVYYASIEMPLFFYVLFDELAYFKFFIYKYTSWVHRDKELIKFNLSGMHGEPQMLQNLKDIVLDYYSIDSIEIWSSSNFDNTLSQIKYFLVSGLFENSKDAIHLVNLMDKLADKLKAMSISGYKRIKNTEDDISGKFILYSNEIINTNNTILVKADTYNALYTTFDHPNYLRTTNPKMINHMELWMQNLVRKSTPITEGSDKDRLYFFKTIKQKIQRVKEEIEYIIAQDNF